MPAQTFLSPGRLHPTESTSAHGSSSLGADAATNPTTILTGDAASSSSRSGSASRIRGDSCTTPSLSASSRAVGASFPTTSFASAFLRPARHRFSRPPTFGPHPDDVHVHRRGGLVQTSFQPPGPYPPGPPGGPGGYPPPPGAPAPGPASVWVDKEGNPVQTGTDMTSCKAACAMHFSPEVILFIVRRSGGSCCCPGAGGTQCQWEDVGGILLYRSF